MRADDSEESAQATCNSLHSKSAGSNLEGTDSFKEKGDVFMHIALAVAFGTVAVSPFVGRWRANVWLRKNMPAERTIKGIPEVA
jgi:hypothetical protein